MRKPRTVRRGPQPRHRSRSVSASTSAPLPREYEFQELRAEGRAIDPAAVERMVDATRGAHIAPGELEHIWRGPPGPPAERSWPDPAGAWYCPASIGPRRATPPSPLSCAARPRRSSSLPSTAPSDGPG